MKYAVFSDRGKQYRVSEGDELFLDRLNQKNEQVEFSNVLLYVEEGNVKVGNPYLEGTKVVGQVLAADVKGEKIQVLKYKAKSRYRKRMGHRPLHTKVKIEKIFENSSSEAQKATENKVKTTSKAIKL